MSADPRPILLVPGVGCSPRLFAGQMAVLWQRGPVMVADHRRGETIAAIAAHILAGAPQRFALAGLSMGGYIAFEMMRQAPGRVERLALLDTSARPETPAQTETRLPRIALAEGGHLGDVSALSFPLSVHPSRHGDAALREHVTAMLRETGAEAYVRQQRAIMGRPDSRPDLAGIRCPTLILVGDSDVLTPPQDAADMAAGIPGAHLVTVSVCGHLSTLERPDEVSAALAGWLAA